MSFTVYYLINIIEKHNKIKKLIIVENIELFKIDVLCLANNNSAEYKIKKEINDNKPWCVDLYYKQTTNIFYYKIKEIFIKLKYKNKQGINIHEYKGDN